MESASLKGHRVKQSLHLTLVDHNPDTHAELKRAIKSAKNGWELTGYSDSANALMHIQKAPPDVVLVEFGVLGITDCIRRLKVSLPSLPIVVFTDQVNVDGSRYYVVPGASDSMQKAANTEILLQAASHAAQNWSSVGQDRSEFIVSYRQNEKVFLSLTRRQEQVMVLIAKGVASNKELSAALGIAEGSVHGHLARIFEKLGVNRRSEALFKYKHLVLERSVINKD